MKFFSGFCLKNEKDLFRDYLEENEFNVAGFSYGAQKALRFALNSAVRIDKLQLFSPAFFVYNEKLINLNINAFKIDKKNYIKNFLSKAGCKIENEKCRIGNEIIDIDFRCSEKDLYSLFTFEWEIIKQINNIKIEIFLGEYDKIIALKQAVEFFKNFGDVYLIKKSNHFLRS